MNETIEDRVLKAIEALFEEVGYIPDSELKLDARLIDDLGCDSLDHVEITMALEDAFSIEIPDDTAADCMTPADFAKAIRGLLEIAA